MNYLHFTIALLLTMPNFLSGESCEDILERDGINNRITARNDLKDTGYTLFLNDMPIGSNKVFNHGQEFTLQLLKSDNSSSGINTNAPSVDSIDIGYVFLGITSNNHST